jgi:aspartyl-tRNA(Asn)/glutamyl-tRNA(Gln) amidotransferase subunit A
VSVARLAEQLRRGELSPREAVESYLERISRLDGELNVYISVRGDEALAEADALERQSGPKGPLYGVPVAVKDVIDVEGVATTAGSRILADSVPESSATAVERLRAAGAIVLGKLNTHEFAYGAMTTSPHFGPCRNPWSTDRICGGSSGGSGACAAADLAAGTLGTDTAGSIRIPSCFNGVTGVRPTHGLVSNAGVVPVAWTFDTVGPIARSAEDCALLLQAIAGPDPRDPTTSSRAVDSFTDRLDAGSAGLRVGVVRSLFEGPGIDPRVADAVAGSLDGLREAGARLVDVEVELLDRFGTIQQAMQFVEAASVHLEWLRTRLSEYGPDVRARLLAGLFLPSTTYTLGQRTRRLAYASFERALREVDVLAAPTMPVTPPLIGEETVELDGATVAYRLALIPFNSPWSLVGAPVVSVPAGFVDGLPVGLALVGRRFGEATLLRVAHSFQRVTDWHERRPPLAAGVSR